MTTQRLDRVSVFGDHLSFLIPHEWVESEEAGDNYLYHAPGADSGWLRVSLISIKGPKCHSAEELRSLLDARAREERGALLEVGDNIVVAWKKDSEEDGVPITNFWWAVGHFHGPALSHEAMFSFTVLREREGQSETLRTVEMVGNLVGQASFTQPNAI